MRCELVQSKKRLPRIDRYEEVKVNEDENQHLWAVSYSDFLMALLSFFILFFSIETPQREEMILRISSSFESKGAVPGGTGSGNGLGPGPGEIRGIASAEKHTTLSGASFAQFADLNVNVDKNKQSLIVNFPDDFFEPGRHQIDPKHAKLIINFLEVLKPYQNKIHIFFEGHSDTQPLQKHKNDIVVDNYVLSSLRAASALRVAQNFGFAASDLFINAAASNIRNSRTLSVKIEAKRETL
jgi:flagellar motor protein MotB